MLVRFDNADIDSLFSIDGYINGQNTKPALLAEYVLERLQVLGAR